MTPVSMLNDAIFDISDPASIDAQKSHPAFLVIGSEPVEPDLIDVRSDNDSCLRLVDLDGTIVREINYRGDCYTPAYMSSMDDILCVTTYSDDEPVAAMIHLPTMKVILTQLDFDGGRAWGSGRAVPSGAYKVVRSNSSLECEVCTIGDGDDRWRKRKSFRFRVDYNNRNNHTAAVNGTLHFFEDVLPDETGSVLRFDLEREEWKSRIKGPPNVKLGRRDISLGELEGSLCMLEQEIHNDNFGYTNIWLLTDSDESL